jgi:Spy/CpxP family protein refolding chaperone
MKRRIATMVLTLGVAALLAMPAFAQQPKHKGHGSRMPMGGGAGLIANEGVQKELKLTDEQTSKAEAVARDVREKHHGEFAKVEDLDAKERSEKMAEIVRTMISETNKGLADVLKPEQMKRYRQIQLQQLGLMAFTEPEVQSKLKLTDDQVGQIRRINADSQSQRRELFQGGGGGGNREEMQKKEATLGKESMDKALAVLSANQKQAWKDMTGEPFEVKFQGFPVFRRPNN